MLNKVQCFTRIYSPEIRAYTKGSFLQVSTGVDPLTRRAARHANQAAHQSGLNGVQEGHRAADPLSSTGRLPSPSHTAAVGHSFPRDGLPFLQCRTGPRFQNHPGATERDRCVELSGRAPRPLPHLPRSLSPACLAGQQQPKATGFKSWTEK